MFGYDDVDDPRHDEREEQRSARDAGDHGGLTRVGGVLVDHEALPAGDEL